MTTQEKFVRIPLSRSAKRELIRSRFAMFALPVMFLVMPGMPILFSLHLVYTSPFARGVLAFIALSWLAAGVLYWRARRSIMRENAADHAQSKKIEYALAELAHADVRAIVEGDSLGSGRPFRVEREVSHATRGELAGSMELHGTAFIGFWARGTFEGTEKGYSIPDLLDTSSMVLLERPDGTTLRVLVPSPRTTKEMLVRTVERLAGDCGRGTHSADALLRFALSEEGFEVPLSHPATIDSLDAACATKALPERPEVAVWGREIQPGVALASALAVAGRPRETYFPTGYLAEFGEQISRALGAPLAPPALAPAVTPAAKI